MSRSHSLRIDFAPVQAPLYEAVIHHPSVIVSSRSLIERGATASRIQADQPSVYVFQREFAVVPHDPPCVVGSDRATTCNILIVSSSKKVFCAHLDGSHGQMAALMSALRNAFVGETALDVHLAGGFSDYRGLSVSLGRDLLAALDRGWPGVQFSLKTACIGPLNTAMPSAPIIRALALDTRTNELIPNAWFDDRGPNVEWRAARANYGIAPLVGAKDRSDTIFIPDRQYLEEMLTIDDDRTLLQLTSTSPDVEHDSFCAETRATIRYLLGLKS
jgi:hypothetical protein